MSIVIKNEEATMTLKEITDLLEVQHSKAFDKVIKMAENKGFGTVSILDFVYNDKGQTIKTIKLNRTQSIMVSAKLNDELLIKVVNRLDELETQQPAPLTFAETMYQALSMADVKVKEQAVVIKALTPKALVADKMMIASSGSLSITGAAKVLQVQPRKVLIPYLICNKWLYKVGSNTMAYQDKIQRGLMEVKRQVINGINVDSVLLTESGIKLLARTFALEVCDVTIN